MASAADLVFGGGRVFCSDPGRRHAQAVAVRGGRIVAVGTEEEVLELAGPTTEHVDLAGGLLLPGFGDAHVHPTQGGLQRLQCDLSGSTERGAYLHTIASYAAAHPDAGWIVGGGWSMAAFPGGTPTAGDLDAIVPDRPVYLANRDHHGVWVNSRALAAAGVDSRTADPRDGRIERYAGGTPTGCLHEGAMDLVGRLLPPVTAADQRTGLLEGQRYLHSLGVTAWQDAILGGYAGMGDALPTYLQLADEGLLTARVEGALWWDRDRGIDQLPELVERRESGQAERFRAGTVKVMQDGVVENFTAAMLTPYLDRSGEVTDNAGLSFVAPAALREYITALDAAGFQVHVHVIGDRAVREALDAIEAARRANGPNDLRHHLAHIQVIEARDIERFRDLGVTANVQALWAVNEPQMVELTVPFLGAERTSRQYPFASLARRGVSLAMGSDWPVSSPDPWWAIHVAVNRTAPQPDLHYPPFQPEQALDLGTAVTAYTAGSAFVNHLDETGTIAPGRLADLVVTDRDPFSGPLEEIGATRVVATFVEGEQVA